MARIRSIKPEFWSSEQVMSCSRETRLLFIGLWNFCDDSGHFPIKPNQIKAVVFPGDNDITSETVLGMLAELSANGLIAEYVVDGQKYLEITGWHHQKIDKPQKPKHPFPPERERSPNSRGQIATERNTEYRIDGNGVESDKHKIKEGEALSRINVIGLEAKQADILIDASVARRSTSKNNGSLIDPKYRPAEHLIGLCHADGATDAVIDHELRMFIATKQEQSALSDNWDASWVKWWGRWKERQAKELTRAPTWTEGKRRERGPIGYQPTAAEFERAAALFAKSASKWSSQLGPEPGAIGCKCPPDILRKHGIDPETGLRLPDTRVREQDLRNDHRRGAESAQASSVIIGKSGQFD
jgi:hypothetical protein